MMGDSKKIVQINMSYKQNLKSSNIIEIKIRGYLIDYEKSNQLGHISIDLRY